MGGCLEGEIIPSCVWAQEWAMLLSLIGCGGHPPEQVKSKVLYFGCTLLILLGFVLNAFASYIYFSVCENSIFFFFFFKGDIYLVLISLFQLNMCTDQIVKNLSRLVPN